MASPLASLIKRPIAVLLSFFVLFGLAVLATLRLPISLLPETGIPRLSVQISYPNASARTIESSVLQPLRNQLLQLSELEDIRSESRDESALIFLDFPFGTDTELTFIALNEQVDQAMNFLPRDLPRPRVVAGDLSDIPVAQLAVTLKNADVAANVDDQLLELSEWGRKVMKRRLEQIPEIAFADLSGTLEPMIRVEPDEQRLRSLQLTESELSAAIVAADLPLGQLQIRDGHYLYSARFANRLQTVQQIADLWLRLDGRNVQLKELAEVSMTTQRPMGYFLYDDRPGIVFNLHKRADAGLFGLRNNLDTLIAELEQNRSELFFAIDQDQTKLLSVGIGSLLSSLLYGAGFAALILFAFFRSWRRPLLIILAVPIALSLALLGFWLTGLSINLISLAGLILGLGLMIDNSIIVLDNIRQFRQAGEDPQSAAVKGGDEIIRPLLASAFTTIAVFLPLVFLSGLAGALFYDQAVAVSLALAGSLLVAYLLLPHLGLLFSSRQATSDQAVVKYPGLRSGVDGVLTRPWLATILGLLFLSSGYWCLLHLPTSSFPELSRSEFTLDIDWGESLPLNTNKQRSREIRQQWQQRYGGHTATYIGERQFTLELASQSRQSATLNFYLPQAPETLHFADSLISDFRRSSHSPNDKILARDLSDRAVAFSPLATFQFSPLPNPFDRAFLNDMPYLSIRLRNLGDALTPDWAEVQLLLGQIDQLGLTYTRPPLQLGTGLLIDYEALARSKVAPVQLEQRLLSLFSQNELTRLPTDDRQLLVILGQATTISRDELLASSVANEDGYEIPISSLVRFTREEEYQMLTADRRGEYLAIDFTNRLSPSDLSDLQQVLKTESAKFDIDLSGRFFKDQDRLRELSLILLISLALLFLILAIQFESLRLPWVVLLTVPFSLIGGLWANYFWGQSLNLVAMIGMVVTGGIVVNDAIIKVDMIEKARASGHDLRSAIHLAGERRLAAILLTSLTTILALLPILFGSGLGAELQVPLAITVIGGLIVGTLASLFLVPLFYLWLARK
ncbi:MAG: efflux RND transporter permease subunit [Bacteroidota bacterium]